MQFSKFDSKEYRTGFVAARLKVFLAGQIRAMRRREDFTQEQFAKMLGTHQSVVGRMENSDYGKMSIDTLLKIAEKLDVALVVRFVSFKDWNTIASNLSDEAFCPKSYTKENTDGRSYPPE